MTPLLPCRPAILSPTLILRFWATDTRTSRLTPGWRSSLSSRRNSRTSTTLPRSPCGRRSELSFTSRAFSPKIARRRRSSAVSSVSPFGRDLADEDVAGPNLRADVDDPLLVEVLEGLLADVRDVPGDLLRAELRVARLDLVLLDVDAREQVVLDEAVADDDRVLVVAALPAHVGDEDVAAERELALVRRAAVRDRLALGEAVADVDDRALVDAGALVAADELLELVLVELAGVRLDLDPLGGHAGDDAAAGRRRGPGPESRAARSSMPVPTIGDSGSRSGTAWRCMFEPMRARLASSCSRNGMSAVATETTCFGDTSMYSIWSGRASGNVSR